MALRNGYLEPALARRGRGQPASSNNRSRRRLQVGVVSGRALLCGGLSLQHLVAVGDAVVFLGHDFRQVIVAGAGRIVVAVGPDRGARIVGEERTQEFVAVIRTQRIVRGAYCIANRIRPLRRCLGCLGCRRCRGCRRCNRLRGLKESLRRPWLIRSTDRTLVRCCARGP